MKANWITLIPHTQSIWLHIGFQTLWLTSKDFIVASPEPAEEGWHQNKYSFRISDQEAKDIMFEWLNEGPFVLNQTAKGEESLLRFPQTVQESIHKIERSNAFKQFADWRHHAA